MGILSNYLIWAAVAVFFIVRQFMPTAIRTGSLVLVPLVMACFGVQAVVQTPPETLPAVTVFALDAVAGVVLGLARGASTKVWQSADGTWMRSGTALTLGLWIVSIAARVGLGFLGHGAVSFNEITFFLALTFGAQNLVVWLRTCDAGALSAVEVR
jgi:hypothetical protein